MRKRPLSLRALRVIAAAGSSISTMASSHPCATPKARSRSFLFAGNGVNSTDAYAERVRISCLSITGSLATGFTELRQAAEEWAPFRTSTGMPKVGPRWQEFQDIGEILGISAPWSTSTSGKRATVSSSTRRSGDCRSGAARSGAIRPLKLRGCIPPQIQLSSALEDLGESGHASTANL